MPLSEELQFAESYIFLQKTRLDEALQVELNLPPAADLGAFYLPPLALQLLLENALKHNTAYQADPLVWHGPFKRPTLHGMQHMLAKINAGPGFGALPTLWIHGDDDRLVLMAQSQTAINMLKGNDFESMVNPGGRHESFNETNKDQILRRIGSCIERVLG